MNGERLLECLWEVDYELRHNSMYKDIMAAKETAPKPVGGVGPRSKRQWNGFTPTSTECSTPKEGRY